MVGSSARNVVLKAGSCAAGHCETGQVRKEAALSGRHRVPQECLARAGGRGRAGHADSTAGGTIDFTGLRVVSYPVFIRVWKPVSLTKASF